MSTKTTRRTVLAGAAGAATLATAAFAAIGPQPSPNDDPIFAAIERHKVVFRISQVAGRIQSNTCSAEWAPEYDPVEYEAAEDAANAAFDAHAIAANLLTTTRPSTIGGVLALLRHVDAFNAGAFELNDGGDIWRSMPTSWPAHLDDEDIDMFGYAILANARAALEALVVR